MRICITGIGGFAGSFLAELLLKEGYDVHGILSVRNDRSNLSHLEGRITLYSIDLCSRDVTADLIDIIRPEGMLLLAAEAVPSQSFKRVGEVLITNSLINVNVYEALRTIGLNPRVVCVSSSDVYGPETGTALREESKIDPLNPYGISKHIQESLCRYYGRVYSLGSIVVRPFVFTGPRQKPLFAVPSFARQIVAIEKGEQEPVIEVGNLDVVRDYSDVRDIVRGIVAALQYGREGEVYNLCSSKETTLRKILEILIGHANVPIRIMRNETRLRPFDTPRIVGDHSKAFNEIHWTPTIPLATTLQDTLNYWRAIAR